MKNDKKIRTVVEEAAKILKDYPHLKYYQAIIKAKEVLKDDIGRGDTQDCMFRWH